MLDEKGFDLWANDYDRAVGLSDEDGSYPFAGYRDLLNMIYRRIMTRPQARVLDLGFGTAALTARLYEQGCRINGQDFSRRMIELAREKMPEARLYHGDFSEGIAAPLREDKYDFIVSTYALHHLDDSRKINLISSLLSLLDEGGELLIGDVAFTSAALMAECRRQAGEQWDDDENYFVIEDLAKIFPGLQFTEVSHCCGMIVIRP